MENHVAAPESQTGSGVSSALQTSSRVEPCEFEALLERAMEVLRRQNPASLSNCV